MLCDKCKKNIASYHSRTIINGIESSEHLCSECVSKMGRDINLDDFSMFDVFDSPFYDDIDVIPFDIFESSKKSENHNNGILDNALKSIKKGAEKFNEEKSKIDPELEKLKNDLKEAVEKEDYEKASQIKKKIDEKNNNLEE